MRTLRKIAVASAAAAALCVAQAVTASACDQHDPAASVTASGSLSHGQVPQPHRCQKGRLLDLRRYGRNHLHRRTPNGCHRRALREGRLG